MRGQPSSVSPTRSPRVAPRRRRQLSLLVSLLALNSEDACKGGDNAGPKCRDTIQKYNKPRKSIERTLFQVTSPDLLPTKAPPSAPPLGSHSNLAEPNNDVKLRPAPRFHPDSAFNPASRLRPSLAPPANECLLSSRDSPSSAEPAFRCSSESRSRRSRSRLGAA